MSHKLGETVNLGLVLTPAPATAAAVGVFDANGLVRTLLATERLIIDNLEANVSSGTADLTAGSTLASSTLIASFNTAVGAVLVEDYAMPVGAGLFAIPGTSTAALKVAGTGRIVNGKTQGVRPSYQAQMTPGGSLPNG